MLKSNENINNETLCPICGKYTFSNVEYKQEICPYCGWKHNVEGEKAYDKIISPNDISLQDYKARYEFYIYQNENYSWDSNKYPKLPKIEPMYCPVCNKHYFNQLTIDDIYFDNVPPKLYCPSCGWHYDLDQLKDPHKNNGANKLSLNEYKHKYELKLAENSNYNFSEEQKKTYRHTRRHKCPVCGQYVFNDFGSYDICPHCGWEDDGLMEKDPDQWEGCANDLCLNDFIKRYKSLVKKKKDYHWMRDKYLE